MSESTEPPALTVSSADNVVPQPLTASDGGGGGATSLSRGSGGYEDGFAAARELGREEAREQLARARDARARDAKRTCARLMQKLKREEAWQLPRQKACEQLLVAEAFRGIQRSLGIQGESGDTEPHACAAASSATVTSSSATAGVPPSRPARVQPQDADLGARASATASASATCASAASRACATCATATEPAPWPVPAPVQRAPAMRRGAAK